MQRTVGSTLRTSVEENIQARNWLYTGEFSSAGQLLPRGQGRGKQCHLMYLLSKPRILAESRAQKNLHGGCLDSAVPGFASWGMEEGGQRIFPRVHGLVLLQPAPNAKAFVHSENIDRLHYATYSFTWRKKVFSQLTFSLLSSWFLCIPRYILADEYAGSYQNSSQCAVFWLFCLKSKIWTTFYTQLNYSSNTDFGRKKGSGIKRWMLLMKGSVATWTIFSCNCY